LEFNNFLGPIPECIGSLVLLEILNLSDNTDFGGGLPIGLCDLVQLKDFEIDDNNISGIKIALK
jgi:hypothetical protein